MWGTGRTQISMLPLCMCTCPVRGDIAGFDYISVGRMSGIKYLHNSTSVFANNTLDDVFSSNL